MSTDTLKTLVEKIEPTAILKIEGPFNDFQAKEIVEIIDDLLANGFVHFIINFAKSNDVNSYGVSVLINVIESITMKEGKLLFSNIDSHLDKKFKMMGLNNYVKFYDSDDQALGSLTTSL